MSAIRKVMDAAGGPVAFSRALNITYQAAYQWERQQYMPLPRAQEALDRWPVEGVRLRDIVRADIAAAMQKDQSSEMLG